ncbi:Retinaldehyde-binding protein 1 [Orchesella cincta]|uniref:Retinaldehyde-binding protein 1 n=1 Tax=Orchesella cincta TaxID=48709 RepID=A0A1D2M1R2_ORCCI|nr:Retinaldehyde-binding protein 1 [Orchesella cincta]
MEKLSLHFHYNGGKHNHSKKKWHSIATGLQIPEEDIEDIQTAIKMDNLSKKDIFIKVLASWHQANDEDATVERLIDTLDGDNLKIVCDGVFKIMIPKNRRDFPSSKEQTNTKDQGLSSAKLPRKSSEKNEDENEDEDDDEEEKLDKLVKAQNQFLLDKADELVELLDLNSTTIAKLLSKKVISKTDVSALDAIPNQLEKNRHFLVKILPSKHDYFTVFFNAMKDTAQSGVVAVLKKFYKTAK